MTEGWLPPNVLLDHVFCCPSCQRAPLHVVPSSLCCEACNWQGTIIGNDTFSFAPVSYDGPRTRTRRAPRPGSPLSGWRQRLMMAYHLLDPWRDWILGSNVYWNSAIQPLRVQEMGTVQRLLRVVLESRRPVLLELGVAFQDHVAFYEEVAEYAICSDIYRDPAAARIYQDFPWAFYCLINVECLPIRESSVDVLFTSHVVEHFPDRDKNLEALRRVLKPGAIACHVVPISSGLMLGHVVGTAANMVALVPRIGQGIHGEYDSVWQELRETTIPAWRALFERCGFEVLADDHGTLGIAPLRPSVSLWLANKLNIYGSWVFVTRVVK